MTEVKKALLVVSFGTSYDTAREKAIHTAEQDLAGAFPDYDLHSAMSSHILLKKLKQQGAQVYSISEALDQLYRDSYQEVLIQTLHVIKGHEYEKIKKQVDLFSGKFSNLRIGQPLLSSPADFGAIADALFPFVQKLAADEGMILMGHGTSHSANEAYAQIVSTFRGKGFNNIWVATVESEPCLDDILPELRQKGLRKIVLMPFMLVAGEHASHDMAGDDKHSWRSVLLNEGLEVDARLTGLGEIEAIRQIYVRHAREALEQE